ncbi:hypothetical protein DFH08DRAFT_969916 [Mycena albidolilacea]|uniref:Uncharacterized protein n=1 Tax=Mycena albidolilacea TaxID=1033008 RepID=A0AAD6ZHB5_9AGAR|nr:hypothetical protein DFH08DRAFT_969916 [Mycena albidolilacea]
MRLRSRTQTARYLSCVATHTNVLCLDLHADLAPPKAPPLSSILDPYTPFELAALLPPCLSPTELDTLLASDTSWDW